MKSLEIRKTLQATVCLLIVGNFFGLAVSANQSSPTTLADISNICQESTRGNAAQNSGNDGNSPYSDSLSANQATRMQGIADQEKEISKKLNLQGNAPKSYSPGHTDRLKATLQTASAPEDVTHPVSSDLETMKQLGPSWVCGISGSLGCKDALLSAISLMGTMTYALPNDTLNVGMISLPNEFTDYMTNPTFIIPMQNLVQTLRVKVASFEHSSANEAGDLFEDVRAAFTKNGVSESDAENYAWEVLGLYSTRGTSMTVLYDVADSENAFVVADLGRVASMISYLDGASYGSGKPYSIPPVIKSQCDYTRPYHFWLAAYLSRLLLQDGYAPKDVFQAVHGIEVLYEEFGNIPGQVNTTTKVSASDVVKQEEHSYYIVETQKNIVANDLGSYWVVNHLQVSSDFDQSLLTLYNSSSDKPNSMENLLDEALSHLLKSNTGYKLKTLAQWKAKVAPDALEITLLPMLQHN
jgi:hypothetical protein